MLPLPPGLAGCRYLRTTATCTMGEASAAPTSPILPPSCARQSVPRRCRAPHGVSQLCRRQLPAFLDSSMVPFGWLVPSPAASRGLDEAQGCCEGESDGLGTAGDLDCTPLGSHPPPGCMEHPQSLQTWAMSITGWDAAPSVPLCQGLAISIPNQAAKLFASLLSWVWGELAMERVLRSHQPLLDRHASHPSGLRDHVPVPWSLGWKLLPWAPAPHRVPRGCQEPSTLQPQTRLFGRVWHGTSKQGIGRTGSAPTGPCARHRLGQEGGAEPPSIIHLCIYRGKRVE